MRQDKTSVVKYGSSVLRSPESLLGVIDDIRRQLHGDRQLFAVVSAFEGETERLLAEARNQALDPQSPDYARLVGQGEFVSAQLLVEALTQENINAGFLSPRGFGFFAQGCRLDGSPLSADTAQLMNALELHEVVVVPGYSAIDRMGDPILLGRGGSDLTAIQIACSIDAAHARLVKNVDGVYDCDPNRFPNAKRMSFLNHNAALSVCGDLIQSKALLFAQSKDIEINITALGRDEGTRISSSIRSSRR